eukprot:CAMPEP_0116156906 /NCGR_PEP_ID=MMETSP0329-20121206/23070_1 /TAXON_ID=697910 /ORGANISM="Pseudo-nitzschia arenysensis, Strain B593" /LENGTH=132 /DNA_ID=CAMNT_0003653997 /DNA_START=687 /DNA_END=1085 /DNA_ORIENTATION=+
MLSQIFQGQLVPPQFDKPKETPGNNHPDTSTKDRNNFERRIVTKVHVALAPNSQYQQGITVGSGVVLDVDGDPKERMGNHNGKGTQSGHGFGSPKEEDAGKDDQIQIGTDQVQQTLQQRHNHGKGQQYHDNQ